MSDLSEKIYERIKNDKMRDVLVSIDSQLERFPPDGKTNHRRGNLRGGFGSRVRDGYDWGDSGWPKNETVKEYRLRMPDDYKWTMERIIESIEKFKIVL